MVVLVLVICIQVLEDARSVIKDFLWLEEAVEFNHRILRRVGSVDDVLLEAHTEVTTDGAWCSLTTVCTARHGSHRLNSVHTFIAAANHWSRHHRVLNTLKERFRCQVCVVFVKQLIRQLHHLHATESQPLTFESGCYLSYDSSLHCTRFQYYKRFLHRLSQLQILNF